MQNFGDSGFAAYDFGMGHLVFNHPGGIGPQAWGYPVEYQPFPGNSTDIPIDPALLAQDPTSVNSQGLFPTSDILVSATPPRVNTESTTAATAIGIQSNPQQYLAAPTSGYPQTQWAHQSSAVSGPSTQAQPLPHSSGDDEADDDRVTFTIWQGDHIHVEEATFDTPISDIFDRATKHQYVNKNINPDIFFADMQNQRDGYWFKAARSSGFTVGSTEWANHRKVNLVAGTSKVRGRRPNKRLPVEEGR